MSSIPRMTIATITTVIEEATNIKTFYLREKHTDTICKRVRPGNYVMVWVWKTGDNGTPLSKRDLIPMSISDCDRDCFSITVKKVGEATKQLCEYNEGVGLGIMGPLGNSFRLEGEHILFIGGGVGVAPLYYLAKNARKTRRKLYAIIGAKSKNELIFTEKLKPIVDEIFTTTDDGTHGKKGVTTDILEDICSLKKINQIFCCGPEKMMYKVLEFSITKRIPAQFSLERYMNCGLGVCGLCSLNHYWVCRDGPVFDTEQLKNAKDFGNVYRAASTIIKPL